MGWFDSETKSRSWTEVDFFGARLESESTRSYIEEGYKENPYVYRAIKLMSQGVASLGLDVFEGTDEMARQEQSNASRLLGRPNPLSGKAAFIERLTTQLLLSGRVFVEAVGPDNGPPRELYIPQPSDIKPIFDRGADTILQGFRSDEAGASWSPEEMHMIRLIDPESPLQGQSVVQAAARVIDVSNYGRKYAHAVLKSMGVPPYLLTTQGTMSEEQKENFREDFAEGVRESFRRMQSSGVTRPKVYDQMEEAEFDQLGMSPQEMELLDLMQQAGREIAVAMGPAPELLGDPENKVYNNVSEAREALYTEHVIPLGHLIADELTVWLGEQFGFGDSRFFGFRKDGIEALKQDPQKQRQMDMEEAKAGLITVNEYRERQGLEPVDGGDVLLIPSTSQPTSTSFEMPEPQTNGESA
jgi:HK97 family phage portal protein